MLRAWTASTDGIVLRMLAASRAHRRVAACCFGLVGAKPRADGAALIGRAALSVHRGRHDEHRRHSGQRHAAGAAVAGPGVGARHGTLGSAGGAHAVKVEGGRRVGASIRAMLNANIPVMGHLGLTPQSIYKFGTYEVRAKEKDDLSFFYNTLQ